MPKIDVTKQLTGIDGEGITIRDSDVELCADCTKKIMESKKPFTLRVACTRALTAITDKTQKLPADKKFARGELARRIYNDDQPQLSAEEVVLLKEAIGDVESIVIVLGAFEMLDPKEDS